MPERFLYLVRHGQYDTTINSADGGSLTELGQEQARITGEALAHLPITALYTSTMTRARETAAHISQALTDITPQPNDLLREAIPTVAPRIANNLLAMMENNPNLTYESIHKDRKRADQAFTRFFHASDDHERHEVIVAHGNIIRYLVCRALDINADTWAKLELNHCGLSLVAISGDSQMVLIAHNRLQHLPAELHTT